MELANRHGMRIEAIIATHVHADHRAGERQLAALTGAPIFFHAGADVNFGFKPVTDGEVISLGNVVIEALHVPGHTPESMALLVTDRTRGDDPWMVLTGDTLFVGDVGRPDLGGEGAAADLYRSLNTKLLTLPDYVEVYPAHISGSPCGRSMSGKPSSTIGFERRHNAALQCGDLAAFTRALFKDLPAKPPGFFDEMIAANRGYGLSRP